MDRGAAADSEAFDLVRSRVRGLSFAPSASFDAGGELLEESEAGYLQIDGISVR